MHPKFEISSLVRLVWRLNPFSMRRTNCRSSLRRERSRRLVRLAGSRHRGFTAGICVRRKTCRARESMCGSGFAYGAFCDARDCAAEIFAERWRTHSRKPSAADLSAGTPCPPAWSGGLIYA
jgi:hypothetical protein